MNYQEVQDFLFSQLPMYQRDGEVAMKKSLNNIIALCDLLDNPQTKIECIHIAGTNGKGSTAHIIAAGLQAHGYSVGLYTSPHYLDYRERIKINGTFITEVEVVDFVTRHYDQFLAIKPSFFEITVAMAFDHFARHEVDVAVIETGLGGRLDSTNIITPIISVITNISMDHQSMLGDTLPLIAGEKAGIIKPNVPIIIGEYQPEVSDVYEQKAKSTGSTLYQADHLSIIQTTQDKVVQFAIKEADWKVEIINIDPTPYQIKNLQTALYALYQLSAKYDLLPSTISSGVANMHRETYYIGRWMKVGTDPVIILDSAHNEAGIRYLTEEIKKSNYHRLHIVFGAASDKDLTKIFPLLPKDAVYYFAKADIPRGMETHILMDAAKDNGMISEAYASVPAAYRMARSSANSGDMIIVAGSIFVIAEVL